MTTPADRLQACLAFTLEHEGGYQARPSDTGNWWDGKLIGTNHGISAPVLAEWMGEDGLTLTADMMKALPLSTARAIYAARFWNPLRCDALPAGADLMVFDFGVNAGIGRSARMLQQRLGHIGGVTVDGFIGPRTLAAVSRVGASWLVPELGQAQRRFYQGLSGFEEYGRGWLRRTEARQRRAATMARGES